jgi:hypothetical protein
MALRLELVREPAPLVGVAVKAVPPVVEYCLLER